MVTVSSVSSCKYVLCKYVGFHHNISISFRSVYINNIDSVSRPSNLFPHWHSSPPVALLKFLLGFMMRQIREVIQVKNKILRNTFNLNQLPDVLHYAVT